MYMNKIRQKLGLLANKRFEIHILCLKYIKTWIKQFFLEFTMAQSEIAYLRSIKALIVIQVQCYQ